MQLPVTVRCIASLRKLGQAPGVSDVAQNCKKGVGMEGEDARVEQVHQVTIELTHRDFEFLKQLAQEEVRTPEGQLVWLVRCAHERCKTTMPAPRITY